jgi:hypothetical protein
MNTPIDLADTLRATSGWKIHNQDLLLRLCPVRGGFNPLGRVAAFFD